MGSLRFLPPADSVFFHYANKDSSLKAGDIRANSISKDDDFDPKKLNI
jgi:hypothetical protein